MFCAFRVPFCNAYGISSTLKKLPVVFQPTAATVALPVSSRDGFENRGSVGIRDMRELLTAILSVQHIEEPLIDAIASNSRHRIKETFGDLPSILFTNSDINLHSFSPSRLFSAL
jgi:hypothetical protein